MIGVVAYLVFFLILALIFGISVLGLNLQWGYTGLFNAGVAGFTAIGAYTMAILTGPSRDAVFGGFELPFVIGLIGAMIASGIVAIIVGLATLKLRHEYLAVATFGIAVSIQLVCLNWEYLTGGTLGLIGIPNPSKPWAEGPLAQNAIYLLIVIIVVGLMFCALERIVKSPWGRTLKAIREDEIAAASLGKSPERVRLEAFVIGCMIMASRVPLRGLHRLCQSLGLSADPNVPDMDHADRRRQRQQSGRFAGRDHRLGCLDHERLYRLTGGPKRISGSGRRTASRVDRPDIGGHFADPPARAYWRRASRLAPRALVTVDKTRRSVFKSSRCYRKPATNQASVERWQ